MKILIVDKNEKFIEILKKKLILEFQFEVITASNYDQTEQILKQENDNYFIALLEANLADAPDGEIIDLVISKNISTVVFISAINDKIRDKILSKNIVDYIIKKELSRDADFAVRLIRRYYYNQKIKVLIVDDSNISREIIKRLLAQYNYIVLEADNGKTALDCLKKNPDIKIVITDYEMPVMTGAELVSQIRREYSKERLAIIGISAHGSGELSVKFLKEGANDFLIKPFFNEEFFCRITQNIELLEYIDTIKEMSNRDYLTGLYNRRYFFEAGKKIFEDAKIKKKSIAVAMIDIDHFKKINDQFGHEAGDNVLKHIANILLSSIDKNDIIARFGGEEFCILKAAIEKEIAHKTFDKIRKNVAKTEIKIGDQVLYLSISIGVYSEICGILEEMLKRADEMLYQAKKEGKNKVVCN